mmetsp:Transcript_23570/g.75628  ORF Transcript_23570/g.75628 Transcript_23570/m.75628 type:complete len:300 (+) Transcript_23570:484-1383(+)
MRIMRLYTTTTRLDVFLEDVFLTNDVPSSFVGEEGVFGAGAFAVDVEGIGEVEELALAVAALLGSLGALEVGLVSALLVDGLGLEAHAFASGLGLAFPRVDAGRPELVGSLLRVQSGDELAEFLELVRLEGQPLGLAHAELEELARRHGDVVVVLGVVGVAVLPLQRPRRFRAVVVLLGTRRPRRDGPEGPRPPRGVQGHQEGHRTQHRQKTRQQEDLAHHRARSSSREEEGLCWFNLETLVVSLFVVVDLWGWSSTGSRSSSSSTRGCCSPCALVWSWRRRVRSWCRLRRRRLSLRRR